MLDAEGIHREVALLSNTLFDFDDADTEGRRPVVEAILDLRKKLGFIRYQIDTGKVHPDSLPRPEKSAEIEGGQSEAELERELKRTNVNISKYKKKLAENPDSKKSMAWEIELDRLQAVKLNLEEELLRVKNYA